MYEIYENCVEIYTLRNNLLIMNNTYNATRYYSYIYKKTITN